MSDSKELGRTSIRSHALLALLAASIGGLLAGLAIGSPQTLVELHESWGFALTIVLVPLQTLISLSLSPIPSDVVAFSLALIHGFWAGALLIWLAWVAGALIQYSLARRVTDEGVLDNLLEKAPHWLRRFEARHPLFLICGRWFPLGPHIVNTAAGIKNVPIGVFVLSAMVGIAPVALLIAGLATGLVDIAAFLRE